MPSNSYWEHDTFLRKADFIVVGGGIVGLNAALHFKQLHPKARVVLLERGTLPTGASTRNAGFACFGSPTELLDDLQQHSEEEVWNLVRKRWEGLQRLRAKVQDVQLGYVHHKGYEIFRPEEATIFEACTEKLGYFNARFEEITGVPKVFSVVEHTWGFQGVQHLICSEVEGQLHPAKMMRALYRKALQADIQILNGFEVKHLEEDNQKVTIEASSGIQITTEQVLIATNGFAQQLLPDLAVKPARNQVLITKPIPNLKWKGCFHYDKGYYYFRNIGKRVLLGGGRNLAPTVEQTDAFGNTAVIQDALQDILQNIILPQQKVAIEHWWSGILGIGTQKKPIVQLQSERIGVAVRMGGMGIAIGSSIGERAAEMMAGR